MTFVLSLSCFLIAFAPAIVIFKELISKDPLRIILFVLGAFFLLISLLVTSLIWFLMLGSTLPALFISIPCQEAARALYYLLLHRAQSRIFSGLAKLASNGVEVTGIRLLYSSRHSLAIVCGLGFGVMASLFLLLNVLADSLHDGIVGLPASLELKSQSADGKSAGGYQLQSDEASFPLFYSISCSLLVLLHVCWAVSLWDGLHKWVNGAEARVWWLPVLMPLVAHTVNSASSLMLGAHPFGTISIQLSLTVTEYTIANEANAGDNDEGDDSEKDK